MQTKNASLPQLDQFDKFVYIPQGKYATWNQKDVPNDTCIVVQSIESCSLITIQSGDTITVGYLDSASCYTLDVAKQTIGSLIDDHNKKRGGKGDDKTHLAWYYYGDPKLLNGQQSVENQNVRNVLELHKKSITTDKYCLNKEEYGTSFSEYFLGKNASFRLYCYDKGKILSMGAKINGEIDNTWTKSQSKSVPNFLKKQRNSKSCEIFDEANNNYLRRWAGSILGMECPAEKLDISEHLTQPSIFPSINKIEEDKTRSPIFPPIEKIVERNPDVQFNHGFLKGVLGVKSYDEQLEKIKKTQQQGSDLER